MTFLQPWMLFALPLMALPVIIHLINQRRFRTIRWGAMMFLLAANRMSRGYARIRQWLILAARTLAIAGLLLAVSRPLASGWMSLAAGGRPDTTLILLDRSPSMQQQGPGGISKLDSAKRQLVRLLGLLGSNRWVLIDSVNNRPIEFDTLDDLEQLPETQPTAASADLPSLLQTAYDYVRENRPSRTEIWIASDVRRNDWDDESGRWQAVREGFLELPLPVRFHLLAFPDVTGVNRSVRVTNVRRVETPAGAELLLSLQVETTTPGIEEDGEPLDPLDARPSTPIERIRVPIQIEVDGARSEVVVELAGGEAELQDHSIPLDEQQIRGWGRVSIPADANPADNEFFFVYDRPVRRKTLIVADDATAVRPLELAAGIPVEASIETTVETLTPEQAMGADWENVALLLWQAELPGADLAEQVLRYVQRGGQVLYFPPESLSENEFAGMRWGEWEESAPLGSETSGVPVTGWVADQDLLTRSRSGAALPVGELRVRRYRALTGERTALATLAGGAPLLCRTVVDPDSLLDAALNMVRTAESETQYVYFCTTTVSPRDSSLARDGVVLYVMVQRALHAGATALGGTAQFIAGRVPVGVPAHWERITPNGDVLPTEYSVQAGVYRQGDRLFAINRQEQEDRAGVVPDARVASLFDRLDFFRTDVTAGSGSSLLSEIWRGFLALMMAALLVEAALCLPRIAHRQAASKPVFAPPPTEGVAT